MLEAWSTAPVRAKCLNLTSLLLTLLTFISCCVSFGAELFTAQSTHPSLPPHLTPLTLHFYYDRIESRLGHSHFADMYQYDGDNRCTDGGRTLVAFTALAFLALTASLALTATRILSAQLRWLPLPRQSTSGELYLSAVSGVLLLLSVALYGSLCYRPFQSNVRFVNVRATGYGYSIGGVLFAVAQLGVCWVVRRDEQCWLGVAEGSEYWTNKARGDSDGYQEEKLSGFEERERASGSVEEGEVDEEEVEEERRHKRSRSKSHRTTKGRPQKVRTKMIAMHAIDPHYNYTYQTSEPAPL